ncbi:MAG: L-lysine 6-transaminase [Planctomycetes bacterium]|nr:L-lysine 6-transaminase [Planctomycetota bacterium]
MIDPKHVHETLKRHQLADGFPMVLDLDRSHGSWMYDARENKEYLDFFTCFASWPLGYNHPGLKEPKFLAALTQAALNNPSNSDLYTSHMAEFVETFATKVTPQGFPHHFWVTGGALAVENALKAAFDWKARKTGLDKIKDDGASLVVLHFKAAFHGRSGYTLSVTNTDTRKVALFPKFDWPRVHNPVVELDLDGKISNDVEAEEKKACAEIDAAFQKYKGKIAAILIEPMQGEGGDNHFRTQFLKRLRQYADENEALLVFDEVQTGFFGSGKPWMWQHHDVRPDIVAFGKKAQVCGIYAGTRIDDVADNVFKLPSRINSTWGGSLTDMVRSRRFIEIIVENDYCASIAKQGTRFVQGLRKIGKEHGGFTNVRGLGSLVAFTLATADERNKLIADLRAKGMLALSCGPSSVRFRLPLVVTEAEIDTALERISACLTAGRTSPVQR